MITGQTHPDFPAIWTPDVAAQARDHALEDFKKEVAGIVVDGQYVRLANTSTNPETEIALSDDDMLRVANAQLFFHSHPNSNTPSAHDMAYQQQLGIPFVVLSVPDMDLFCFGDECGRSPLVGRGFRHGVHDCVSLIRDWYFQEKGVALENKPRDWGWWNTGGNLYLDNYAANGFREISVGAKPMPGDVYLFQFNYKVPMHGAVVLDSTLLLHHPAGHRGADKTRLSCAVPRQRYAHLVTHRLRHSSNAA